MRCLCGLLLVISCAQVVSAQNLTALEALDHVGESRTVEFVVRSTGTSKKEGYLFLNSEENFRSNQNFSVVMDPATISRFHAKGIKDIQNHYFRKKIAVTGKVEHFKSVTDIKVTDPSQIEITDMSPPLGFEPPKVPESTPDNFDPTPPSYLWIMILALGIVMLGVGIFVGKQIKAKEPVESE